MTWKTPLLKASAGLVAHRPGVVSQILRNEDVVSFVTGHDRLLRELFGPKGPWRRIFSDPVVRSKLGLDKEASSWASPEQVLTRLNRENFLAVIDKAEAKEIITFDDLFEHYGGERFLRQVPREQLLERFAAEELLDAIEPEQMLERLGAGRMLAYLGPQQMMGYLGTDTMMSHIGPDPMLDFVGPKRMLSYLGSDRMLEYLGPEPMLNYLGVERMLAYIGPERVLSYSNPERLLEWLGPEQLFSHVGVERLLDQLGLHRLVEHFGAPHLLDHIGARAAAEHFGAAELIKQLELEEVLSQIEPSCLLEHLGSNRMLEYLSPEAFIEHYGSTGVLESLEPKALLDHLGPDRMLDYLGAEKLVGYLGPETIIEHIGAQRTLDHVGPERMLEYLGPDQVIQSMGPEDLMNHLGADRMFEYLGPKRMMDFLGLERMMDYIRPDRMYAYLGPDRMIRQLGPERILSSLSPAQMVGHMGVEETIEHLPMEELARRIPLETFLEHADPHGTKLAAYVGEHQAVANSIGKNEEAMKRLLTHYPTRQRLRELGAVERAAKLPYALPATVLSFPRSGSNFLQSILNHSTGMNNVSLYMEEPLGETPLLTVKSHALSPEYLSDEYDRILEMRESPGRVVLVKRDPRDVMISFYEYTKIQRQAEINQSEFLKNVDFFYASTIDKDYSRRVEKGPLSVHAAYKKHVREWFGKRPARLNVMEVRYEDLVTNPRETFRAILDYLEIDLPVAESFLNVKVSLYSDEKRPRGIPHAWKECEDKYKVLLEGVERFLAKEIKLLGYDDAADAPANTAPPKSVNPGRAEASDSTKNRPIAREKAG